MPPVFGIWGPLCTLKSRRDRASHRIECGQHNERFPKRSSESCSRLEDITDGTLSYPSRELTALPMESKDGTNAHETFEVVDPDDVVCTPDWASAWRIALSGRLVQHWP